MGLIKRIKDKFATVRLNNMLFEKDIARKLPIQISSDIKFGKMRRGCVTINAPISTSMIRIGFGGSDVPVGSSQGKMRIFGNGHVQFNGKALFAEGLSMRVTGSLTVGNNVVCNSHSCISCSNEMSIGDDVLMGWNIVLRDTDGHTVIGSDGCTKAKTHPVHIGNHVWVCAFAHILRASVADGCIVAWGARMFKSCDEKNALVGGFPAKVLQSNVSWEE